MPERVQRMAVAALGVVTIIVVIGLIILAAMDDEVPEALVAIGSASLGALAGIVSNNVAIVPRRAPMEPTVVQSPPPTTSTARDVTVEYPLPPNYDPANPLRDA